MIMERADSIESYVLCIDNGGYPESLEVRKVYAVLPDERAAENDYIRVIDETGEDYLYPSKYFVRIQLPAEAAKILPAGHALRNGRPT
jgi:hypothetical protein